MFGNVNGMPWGSPAGDAEVTKIIQPLLDKYSDAHLDYDEYHTLTLSYHGHKYNLECIFDPIHESMVVEVLEQTFRDGDKEAFLYATYDMLEPIFRYFPEAAFDWSQDTLTLSYRGHTYDLETVYNVVKDPIMIECLTRALLSDKNYEEGKLYI